MYFQWQALSRLLFPLLWCLLLSSCNIEKPPVKIGLSINLSGPGGAAGEHIRNGALLAIKDINRAGGIKGRPVELLVMDDHGTMEGAVETDRELMKTGVSVVVGHSMSSTTLAAYPVVTANNILLITAYAATTKLSAKKDLFFRTCVDCSLYGEKTAELLKERGAAKVAFLMDMTNPSFVSDYVYATEKNYNGQTYHVKFSPGRGEDWDSITAKLLAPRPDAIVMLTEATMTGIALQKLRMAGYSGPGIATLWAQTPGLLRYAAGAGEGLSIVTFIPPEIDSPEYRAFQQKMEMAFHEQANARSARSYELLMILSMAMNRAESFQGPDIARALNAQKYQGLLGQVAFDRFGDVLRPVYEVIINRGKFEIRREL